MSSSKIIHLKGSKNFRYRVAISILSGTPIKVTDIRLDSTGLTDYEVSFLELIYKLTNNSCRVNINDTGTEFTLFPSPICVSILNSSIEHVCSGVRNLTWFAEPLLVLLPFSDSKDYTKVTLLSNNINNNDDAIKDSNILNDINNNDLTLYTFKEVTAKLLSFFQPDLKVLVNNIKYGIELIIPSIRNLNNINVSKEHKLKLFSKINTSNNDYRISKVRGLVSCSNISLANNIINNIRINLNNYLPDVYIYFNNTHKQKSKLVKSNDNNNKISNVISISLIASNNENTVFYSSDYSFSNLTLSDNKDLLHNTELLAQTIVAGLLNQISTGATVDTSHQHILILLMALANNISAGVILDKKLSSSSIGILKLIYQFFGIKFHIKEEMDSNNIILSCKGNNYLNTNKQLA